jgi:Raf kinase inhibitor-like YbhB/YbcL family protein
MLDDVMHRLGGALRNVRPGMGALSYHRPEFAGVPATIRLESPAFRDGEAIPARHTGDGTGASPPLAWQGVPEEAAGLVLLVEDADAPFPRPLVHAIAPGLPPTDGDLAEAALPNRRRSAQAEKMGRNSYAARAWLRPAPVPGHGPHRYAFQLFATDIPPQFPHAPGRSLLLRTITGHVIARGRLIGTYERP